MRMGRINVYLPDRLHAQAKRAGLNVSELCQKAIDDELRRRAHLAALDEYIAELEGLLGPATPEEMAAARLWAKDVAKAAQRARARAASQRARSLRRKSA